MTIPSVLRTGRTGLRYGVLCGLSWLSVAGAEAQTGTAPSARPVAKPHPHRTRPAPRSTPHEAAETVTVTGARRFGFSKQQRAPDSETNISAQTLVQREVNQVTDLQKLVPNLTVQSLKGTQSINYHLRGVGFDDYYENNMSSVLVYIDGVPFPFSTMTDGMLFDLGGVDVVPGPVGTTHGTADSGGEIDIRTADPTPDWHGTLTEDIASYARSRTTATLSGPISDTVSFRVAAQTAHGGGWQYDPQNGAHLGDLDETAVRAKLHWAPDERTSLTIGAHWTVDDSQLINGNPVLNLDPSFQKLPLLTSYRQTEWDIQKNFAALVGRPDTLKPSEHNVFWGADVDFSRDIGFAQLETISAFETERQGEYSDEDGTPMATGDVYRDIDANLFSQEVRLTSRTDAPLHWGVGLDYIRSRMFQQFFSNFTQYIGRGYISDSFYDQNQQSFSQYANVSYRLPWHLTAFGGLNHTTDDRQLFNFETIQYGVHTYRFLPQGSLTNQIGGVIGLQEQVNDALQLYGKVSRGFKPGGFAANNTVQQAQLVPFRPEAVLAYEIGFKSDPIPGRIRINGAAFYDDYHNEQTVSSFLLPSYGPLGTYVNIPHSNIWGIEASTELHPVAHVYLSGNMGYERGVYSVFQALDTGATNAYHVATGVYKAINDNFSGTDLGIPKLSLDGSAAYRFAPRARLTAELAVDGSYRDSQAFTVGGTGVYRLPPYFLLGAHATIASAGGRWTVTLYGTNLLNRSYSVTTSSETTTYQHVPGEPRFIGVRLGLGF